ncbi:outer membrane protein assembly factor BamA [Pseudohalocynthiibacter aestuariivivens]|uniref:Outer membrane protein assembly factor BamA n=2 Tax=Pseudohalocynthiibacter TaxID=1759417 RepID=A0ABV5JJ32_9RHOB|nr:outer membrane protein assembly factor BamA [Pseudohalocynthiibacter aestuariivivens]
MTTFLVDRGTAVLRVFLLTRAALLVLFCVFSVASVMAPLSAQAQQRFSTIEVIGNQRIEAATIRTYAGIERGESVSEGELNAAYQRILGSGLFETVDLTPQGSSLVITVREYPTINQISIEGNRRLKDENLLPIIQSQPRRVYSPTIAELDADSITAAYGQLGRYATTVDPRIIRRDDNRVDLIFEVSESRVIEIDRLSFVGNRAYSDRRLRRVLETKQAGLLRGLVKSDTFIADRIEFDKQVLRDFYLSRGYIDFETLSVNSELARGRDAFFVTFTVREGQPFEFGEITVTSDLEEVDPDEYFEAIRIRPGVTYSPTLVENTIARLERLALRNSLNFVRVEPRITRNDRELTLDVEFNLSRGPRIFVERIDIEGNSTTLDRVIRNQFRIVEGDPFNPREIRESASRIRALGFFKNSEVEAREGTSEDQVIVDVNVEEAPTGTLSFGASFSSDIGVAVAVGFSERNFLGRGQRLSFNVNTASDSAQANIGFVEPALLGRDLRFGLNLGYSTTDNENARYNTKTISFSPSLNFPVSENGRVTLRYGISSEELFGLDPAASSAILLAEAGTEVTSFVGYSYSYDTRRTGLNPNAGIIFQFGQNFAGLGGDAKYIQTTALLGAEADVLREEVTLRATLEGGALNMISGNSRITDRFFLSSRRMRGFDANGVGPRDLTATNQDALGGNFFAVARFEAEFPLGIPEEYGITGGVFFDVGSLWGLDNTAGTLGPVDDSANLRAVVGFSVFWDTVLGPLRFNFSNALKSETYDEERSFDLTVSTSF